VAPSDLAPMGSIADISARLLLWSQRATRGLTRVEFSSEFSRQRVVDHLKSELAQRQIVFAEIQLPTYREPMEIVDYLLAELEKQTSGVASIHGFSTAFGVGVSWGDAMYALNFNRERIADWPLRQIWWMTPTFYDAAQFAMPDLMSWFNPRLRLTEAVVINTAPELMMTGGTANIDDARQRAEYLIERFKRGNQAGAAAEDLLRLYLLPALEALSEVNAQKDISESDSGIRLTRLSDESGAIRQPLSLSRTLWRSRTAFTKSFEIALFYFRTGPSQCCHQPQRFGSTLQLSRPLQ
jgi:hypothetical protein